MAGEVYQVIGTSVVFSATGDVLFSPASTAFANGHASAQWDRGASPQPEEYSWRAKTKLGAGVVGETIDLYMATSDGTVVDGLVSPGDALFTDFDALKNCLYVGSIVVDNTGTDSLQSSGTFRMYSRYGVLILWNATAAQTLSATGTDHEVTVTPIYPQVQ